MGKLRFALVLLQKKVLSDNSVSKYMSEEEINDFKKGETGIFSITVSGYKSL